VASPLRMVAIVPHETPSIRARRALLSRHRRSGPALAARTRAGLCLANRCRFTKGAW
jgi:hypothetical protein